MGLSHRRLQRLLKIEEVHVLRVGRYYFRVQPLLPTGEQNWSDLVSFIVK